MNAEKIVFSIAIVQAPHTRSAKNATNIFVVLAKTAVLADQMPAENIVINSMSYLARIRGNTQTTVTEPIPSAPDSKP